MELREKILEIQNELKCNKAQYNKFGKYAYRSCEDILEAVKPLLLKHKLLLTLEDDVVNLGRKSKVCDFREDAKDTELDMLNETSDRLFIKAVAVLQDCESESVLTNTALAEIDNHKGMSLDQCTGTASSYARKYALNGLFLIDDTKDADTDEYHNEVNNKKMSTSEKKMFDVAEMTATIMSYEMKGVEIPNILKAYDVNGISEMSEVQMKDCIKKLKNKYGE